MKKPKNQKQQVLWYLINFNFWFSLNTIINDSYFYKFQTRLGELEKEYGNLVERKKTKFKNRFGRPSQYTSYKALDVNKCKKLYKTL